MYIHIRSITTILVMEEFLLPQCTVSVLSNPEGGASVVALGGLYKKFGLVDYEVDELEVGIICGAFRFCL